MERSGRVGRVGDGNRRGRGRRRSAVTTAVLAVGGFALAATACTSGEGAGGPATSAPVALPNLQLASALVPYDSCDDLLGQLKQAALDRVGPYGLPGSGGGFVPDVMTAESGRAIEDDAMPTAGPVPSTAPTSTTTGGAGEEKSSAPVAGDEAYSGTNVQEAGVDEPDTVKTDGERIISILDGRLRIVDVTGPAPALVSTTDLPAGGGQLLLDGDRLLVVNGSSSGYPMPLAAERAPSGVSAPVPYVTGTVLTLVDIADAGAPRVLGTSVVEGSFVNARMVGGTARVVVSSSPTRFPFVYPSGPGAEGAAEAANRRIIEDSTLEDWIPLFHSATGDDLPADDDPGRPLLACEAVQHPKEFSGFGMLSVLSVDVDGGTVDPADAVGVLADGQTVYASPDNLYVATPAYVEPERPATTGTTVAGRVPRTTVPTTTVVAPPARTAFHKFDIRNPGPAAYRASGELEGTLLNEYSMSEYNGDLRVATTRQPNGGWGRSDATETEVSVVRESDGELRRVGYVGDMGRGEQVRAVRFLGDQGYVVTFRQTDPLYTVDLSNPEQPKVVGELKILGYSAYLHPVGEGLLLGIGQDATDRGRTLGTKVALFDVRDPAAPKELSSWKMPGSTTQVEGDYHAFLWWDATKLALVPVSGGYGPIVDCPPDVECLVPYGEGFTGMIGLRVDADAISELGRITHPQEYGSYPPCGPMEDCVVPVPDTDPCPPGAMCATDGSSAGAEPVPGTAVPPVPGTQPTTTAVPIPTTTSTLPTTTTTAPTTTTTAPSPLPPFPANGAPIERAIVIGDTVYTLSYNGLRASHLADLQGTFWLAFT